LEAQSNSSSYFVDVRDAASDACDIGGIGGKSDNPFSDIYIDAA
jgi:hypothetical protein